MAGNAGEVVLLLVRGLTAPHREDDLQPLGREGAEGVVVTMAALPATVVVDAGPLTVPERQEGELVDHGAQVGVAGEAELDDMRFAALLGHRDCPTMALQMLGGLPAARGIAELGPQRGDDRPALAARQRGRPLSRRHAGEKILDRPPDGVDRATDTPQQVDPVTYTADIDT